MATPINCRIYVDTDNTFFIYTTDTQASYANYSFDIYDSYEGYTTNGGWHGVHSSAGLSSTVAGATFGSALSAGSYGGVSYSCRTAWMQCSWFPNTQYLMGRCRVMVGGVVDDTWAYSSSYYNPSYAPSICPTPTSVYWSTTNPSTGQISPNYIYAYASLPSGLPSGYTVNYEFCLVSSSVNWYSQNYYNVASLNEHQQIQFRAYITAPNYTPSSYRYGNIFEMPPSPSNVFVGINSNIYTPQVPPLSGFTVTYDYRKYTNASGTWNDWAGCTSVNVANGNFQTNDKIQFRARYNDSSGVHATSDHTSTWGWTNSAEYPITLAPNPPTVYLSSKTDNSVTIGFSWETNAYCTTICLQGVDISYYREISNYDTSVRTCLFDGLEGGKTYTYWGINEDSNGNPCEDSSPAYNVTLLALPLPPTLYVASNNSISSVTIGITWSGDEAYKVQLRVYRYSDDYMLGSYELSKGTTTQIVNDLDAGARYYAYAWSTSVYNTPSKTNSNSIYFYAKPPIIFDFDFFSSQVMSYNTTTKQAVVTSASNWNNFTLNINWFRRWKGGSDFAFTSVGSGTTLTASIYNEAVYAMMGSPLNLTSSSDLVTSGVTNITANHFNKFKTLLQTL